MLKSSHIAVKAKINGILGYFIIDTGASNTCIGYEYTEMFQLQISNETTFTASASDENLTNHISLRNSVEIGKWNTSTSIVVLDLSTINLVLGKLGIKNVHGIIGADVFIKGNAVIDYSEKKLILLQS